jgi:hypothetical protein
MEMKAVLSVSNDLGSSWSWPQSRHQVKCCLYQISVCGQAIGDKHFPRCWTQGDGRHQTMLTCPIIQFAVPVSCVNDCTNTEHVLSELPVCLHLYPRRRIQTLCLVCKAIIHLRIKETFVPGRSYFRFRSVCSYKYLPHIVTTESIGTGSNAVLKKTQQYMCIYRMGIIRSCKTRIRWKAAVAWNSKQLECKYTNV